MEKKNPQGLKVAFKYESLYDRKHKYSMVSY